MNIQFALIIAFVQTVLVVLPATAGQRQAIAAPYGEYQIVALRNASDVATTAAPNAGVEWLGQRVSFREGQLNWLGGKSCTLWSVRESRSSMITLYDPNLSDLAVPPLDSVISSGDKRVNIPVELICQDNGEQTLGRFVIIDARVLIASAPPWTVNYILERPLTQKQVKKLQVKLKDMKFYKEKITGKLDKATLRSVGLYAEYRGSKYRFFRTVITENLLDGLGVTTADKCCDSEVRKAFPDYRPKRSTDTIIDYRPGLRERVDKLQPINSETFTQAVVTLLDLTLNAKVKPGRWVDGKVALGAEPREYVPSDEELLAAEFGDRLLSYVQSTSVIDLMDAWTGAAILPPPITYFRFDYRHVDVMGSGRYFYASGPIKALSDSSK